MQSLCGWEAERQWEAQILHPHPHVRRSRPQVEGRKIKKPPLIPTMPPPPVREKTAGTDPAPNPNWTETASSGWTGSQSYSAPTPGQSSRTVPMSTAALGQSHPSKAGQCHTATRNDETSGMTHCCSSRHPAPLCLLAWGWVTQCPFLGADSVHS